jgi:hypothetical protein
MYEEIKIEVKLFFEEAVATAKKHFTKEWTGSLMHFAVAGQKETSVPFYKWLVNDAAVKLGLYFRIEAIQFFGRNPVENGIIM